MIIHDISLPISDSLIVWPGDPPVRIVQTQHLDRGDRCTVSRLEMGAHTGTHVDAPAHFIEGGAGIDQLDLDVLVGPAHVVWTQDANALSAEVLDSLEIPPETKRLLFRTCNSSRHQRGETEFALDFVAATDCGARWLVQRGVRLVGIDYLSISPFHDPVPAHEVLLSAGVIIVEGLKLDGVTPGLYQMVCLPLKLAGCEGAPARAILIEDGRGSENESATPST